MAKIRADLSIVDTFTDGNLLGGHFSGPTWRAWLTLWRAVHALPCNDEEDFKLFCEATGRSSWPTEPAKEVYIICGRRSGKSINASGLGTYRAAFVKYPQLAAGERATIPIISPTKGQSRVIRRYIQSFFRLNPFLQGLVERETTWELDLNNGVSIEIMTADLRTVRGYTSPCVILDESAFFTSEATDQEIVRAWRPALVTLNGILVAISSPYSKTGYLYDQWRRYWGKDGDTLVWVLPSIKMNPTLDTKIIEKAKAEDPDAAMSEWEAVWREDIQQFLDRERVEQCVIPQQYELPPISGINYRGFTDPSGGSGDSFTLGIGHEENGIAILDLLREAVPPFNPAAVVKEFADTLKQYGIRTVSGDRYAGVFVQEPFAAHGISYRVSPKTKTDLYLALLPKINSQTVELLDNERLIKQLVGLERHTSRGGRDTVDHRRGSRDDLCNAAAGCLVVEPSNLLFDW